MAFFSKGVWRFIYADGANLPKVIRHGCGRSRLDGRNAAETSQISNPLAEIKTPAQTRHPH